MVRVDAFITGRCGGSGVAQIRTGTPRVLQRNDSGSQGTAGSNWIRGQK